MRAIWRPVPPNRAERLLAGEPDAEAQAAGPPAAADPPDPALPAPPKPPPGP